MPRIGYGQLMAKQEHSWWGTTQASGESAIEGLVPVKGYDRTNRRPEEVLMMEKASLYGATAVFFGVEQNGKPAIAQAFIFNSKINDEEFAKLHQKLWSWGGVPLAYRLVPGLVQLFRCAHQPDFVSSDGKLICKPVRQLKIATDVASDPWWDAERLRNGTLWDDPAACKTLLASNKGTAHKKLIGAVKAISDELNSGNVLPKHLRRKLLILSLLIAYLEQRGVFVDGYFGSFRKGANHFFEVLRDGNALVELLSNLEERFNGHVFTITDADRTKLRFSQDLPRFAKLIEGREETGGQLTLWELYSFKDLPIELISHIYQLFVRDTESSVYTPPFLVRLVLEETLSWERLDRLVARGEIILDPACGSGVFLVEAYKRLVLHWRSRNGWKRPDDKVLKKLLKSIHGIDLEAAAVELAAFSLCLAMCDALEPEDIRATIQLFPQLVGKTLHQSCFFKALEDGVIQAPVGALVGNPPFISALKTPGAQRSYARYNEEHELRLPDKQIAYLFLHEGMKMMAPGGILGMLQQYNFLYNQGSREFRREFIAKWNVREILDFVSVRGLFHKDTKIAVVIAEALEPNADATILHATFRRSGRSDAEQGFDIDYYDLHWLPRTVALHNDLIWRSDLLGGGRVFDLMNRLKKFRTLGDYAKGQDWNFGEGFIEAKPDPDSNRPLSKRLAPAKHLTGKRLLTTTALTDTGINFGMLGKVEAKLFWSSYSTERFTGPMVVIHQQYKLNHGFFADGYLTYKNQIVGFCGAPAQARAVRAVATFLDRNKSTLQAFVAGTSVKLFTQHATTLSAADVVALPYPGAKGLDISANEAVLVNDVVDYYEDLIRLGEDSAAMRQTGHEALPGFAEHFTAQINTVYDSQPLRALPPQAWPGVICQPFVFGEGTIDWAGVDELKDMLDRLLRDQRGTSLRVTRICRIYDGHFVFLLKPDRLRYWLRSVALRDADEVLADLRAQGL